VATSAEATSAEAASAEATSAEAAALGSAEPEFISKDLIAFSAMLSCFISFIQPPKFSETRTPRSTFFVAQATNPDENEDENEP
jgi:hypothetical protein